MKISLSLLFIAAFFFSAHCFSQQNECDKKLLNESRNYIAVNKLKNEDDFYSERFRLDLKRRLVQKISSYVETSTSMKSSFTLKGRKSKKSNVSKALVNAIALVVDPKYIKCGGVAFISVDKKLYNRSQYNNFKRQLTFHSTNLTNLLKGMDDTVSRRFLKKKVKNYTKILKELSSLLPLVKLPKNDNLLMNQFSMDVSNLENKLDQLKQKRRLKLKEFREKLTKGVNNIIDKF